MAKAPSNKQVTPRPATDEPVLEMAEIQGIAVPGFFKPQQVFLYVRTAPNSPRSILDGFQQFLGGFRPTNAAEALADRRAFRKAGKPTGKVLTAVGLSFVGLKRLVPDAEQIESPAFRLGLAARSALLGDPRNPGDPGHASQWEVGAVGQDLDALFVFAGDIADKVAEAADKAAKALTDMGLWVERQVGAVRPDLKGHEHFGFADGVSQPGIRGRASSDPSDFITARSIDPASAPFEASLYGYPGQSLVWPGEFVLGYPASGPDPRLPGPVSTAGPAWTRNGSFLVYRKLYQDVALFWNSIAGLRTPPGGDPIFPSDIAMAARLVGRWPSGAPVSRTPDGEDKMLGGDPYENNNFMFDADTPDLTYKDGGGKTHGTRFPELMAKADPIGLACPLAGHIRKVNTRDSASDTGAALSTVSRRILRVGLPYGPPIKDNYTDDGASRGLLFLSIQASIENQFEFLQARWMNDPLRPKAPSGHDMIVGQNTPANGLRSCVIFPPASLEATTLSSGQQWVQPRGGGYFFLPSLTALSSIVGQASSASARGAC